MKTLKKLFLEAEETSYPLEGYKHFRGIPIEIEQLKGSKRKGKDKDGKKWESILLSDYGRIPLSKDTTGEMLDVYVGKDKDSEKVFQIKQLVPESGKFDEFKFLVGFNSEDEAVNLYKKQYDKKGFFGGIKELSFDGFKSLVFKNILNNISSYKK